MKEYLQQEINKIGNVGLARCIVREYLQARTLEYLQQCGAFVNWAFLGGTSLRFIYSMPRFSEDLDFSIREPGQEVNFIDYMKRVKTGFIAEDYRIEIKAQSDKTVMSAFVKFPGLLNEFGLSQHRNETISIKVEIDSNPPSGAGFETSIIRRYCMLNLQHYDKSSLLAGKLHALSSRKYTKGRDVYDLMWYLSDRTWPEPNMVLLNNAHKQTGWEGEIFTEANWRLLIAKIISEFDWGKVVADIKPFIEKQSELELLTYDNIIRLLNV